MVKKVLFVCAALGASTSVFAAPAATNLEVSQQKVMGQAKGLASEKESLKKEAAANALKNEADILVETDFFYEEQDDSVKVTATGYAAKYVSSSSADKTKENETDVSLSQNEKSEPQYQSGLYVSGKTQSSIPWSPTGGNIQVGWVLDRLFFGADFGAGVGNSDYLEGDYYNNRLDTDTTTYNYYCGGISFGARIQPNNFFQVILGATFGIHTKFEKKNEDDYRFYTLDRKFVFAQGPMVKFLFGRENFWFEISNDLVFGTLYAAYNLKAGVTYAPTRK